MKDKRDAGVFGAVAAVAATVTAGFSWVPVLIGWCIATIIFVLLPTEERVRGKIWAWTVLLGGIFVIAAAALGAEQAFPENSTFPFVSIALLLLLWRAMCGANRAMGNVANLLGMFLLLFLVTVTLFGLGDVRWKENLPEMPTWQQIYITIGAASPWWCLRQGPRGRKTWGWYGASVGISLGLSLLTCGILGKGLVSQETAPLYRAVQTIRILGVLQRLEALLAAAVLMGAFCVLLLTGERIRQAGKIVLPGASGKWIGTAVGLGGFLVEVALWLLTNRAIITEIISVFWGVIPILALWIVLFGKSRKTEKNA